MEKKFTLTKTVAPKATSQILRNDERSANDFVQGKEPTRAKTFNIPIRLDKLRIIAAKRRQTDTDIIVGLIDQFVREHAEDVE